MGWFGKGLSRGGIVPHGRGDDPEPRAVGLPALPDGYWFEVAESGDVIKISVESGKWLSFSTRYVRDAREGRKVAKVMAQWAWDYAGAAQAVKAGVEELRG